MTRQIVTLDQVQSLTNKTLEEVKMKGGAIFDAQAYGAVGDGVADDTTALRAAITALTATGGAISLGRGKTYRITDEIFVPRGVSLIGPHGTAATGFAVGLSAAILCDSATARVRHGSLSVVANSYPGSIENVRIYGAGSGDPTGILYVNCVGPSLRNVLVDTGAGHNIVLDAAQNGVFDNVYSYRAGDAGLLLLNGVGGYSFINMHAVSCLRNLVMDHNGGGGYIFGPANNNFFGGIFESYENGEIIADIKCGNRNNFYGTGFSVNNVIMSSGDVIHLSNTVFPNVQSGLHFNGCLFVGGNTPNMYNIIRVSGGGAAQNYVNFSGENFYQSTPNLVLADGSIPQIRAYGPFLTGIDVSTRFGVVNGGSLASVIATQYMVSDWRLPDSQTLAIAMRREADIGFRFSVSRDGTMFWNDGTDGVANLQVFYDAVANGITFSPAGGTNVQLASGAVNINAIKVLGTQGAAVADATGGATVDAEARTALNALLARLRTHGIIAT